jgi:tRNA G18 (ribose-2'-O)-methylase SpoU
MNSDIEEEYSRKNEKSNHEGEDAISNYSYLQRYLVIANIGKSNNVKQLINTAKSFHFIPVIVGMPNILESLNLDFNQIPYKYFKNIVDTKEYLVTVNAPLIGIEIDDASVSVNEFIFPVQVAFMPGNEGTGLSTKQRNVCNHFVYIPQFGKGTASLNVNTATSIVLHEFARQQYVCSLAT